MELTIREKKLLEYMLANTNVVNKTEQDQSVIDYNVMLGVLQDPTQEENEEGK